MKDDGRAVDGNCKGRVYPLQYHAIVNISTEPPSRRDQQFSKSSHSFVQQQKLAVPFLFCHLSHNLTNYDTSKNPPSYDRDNGGGLFQARTFLHMFNLTLEYGANLLDSSSLSITITTFPAYNFSMKSDSTSQIFWHVDGGFLSLDLRSFEDLFAHV